jgi:nicotinate dehydrogenase subunit A
MLCKSHDTQATVPREKTVMMRKRELFALSVNGAVHRIEAEPALPLLLALRNDLELTGPKFGCGYGECGTCTVIIDGLAARSCVIPISLAQGHEIVTLEGLATEQAPHPVQQSFIDAQAAQCGYCLNGMIMTVVAFLNRNKSPSDAEIANELRFNLCRCGAHIEILEAVKLSAARLQESRKDT